jgi:hypothetical protein
MFNEEIGGNGNTILNFDLDLATNFFFYMSGNKAFNIIVKVMLLILGNQRMNLMEFYSGIEIG